MSQSSARPRKSSSRAARTSLGLFARALVACVMLAPTGALAVADAADPAAAGVAVVESDSLVVPAEGRPGRALQPETESGARALDPEFRAVLDRELAELARLRARFENAPDHAAAIAAQVAIDLVKQHTEIELLQIQARRMRERGFEEQAAELEESVAGMLERLPRRSETQDAPASADPR